jgi:DNA-binding MarR family transcriptional regulator
LSPITGRLNEQLTDGSDSITLAVSWEQNQPAQSTKSCGVHLIPHPNSSIIEVSIQLTYFGTALNSLERNSTELRTLLSEFMQKYRVAEASSCSNGPHSDLSIKELHVIEYLGDAGPQMMRELAEYLLLAVNSVTSIIDNLETKKYIVRTRPAEDRRIVRVELTPEGKSLYEEAAQQKVFLLRCMLQALDNSEQELFMSLFRKIARAEAVLVK